MKLPFIILLTAFLSNNYVMSQKKCPENGIKTSDGTCFYLSTDTCPSSSENQGIPQNEAEFGVFWEMLRNFKKGERICMPITDYDLKSVLDHQPHYIRKLNKDKKVLLNLPTEDYDALHVVFKIIDPSSKSTLAIGQSSKSNNYIGKIEIFNHIFTLSTLTEIPVDPVSLDYDPNSGVYYDIIFRFMRGSIHVSNNIDHSTIAKIETSWSLNYPADMISIENVEVIQLDYQDMKCQNGETYRKNSPGVSRSGLTSTSRFFERSIIKQFNLNTALEGHEVTLNRRNDWAENFTFHLLGQNPSKHLDFELIFDTNSNGASLVYTCLDGSLSMNYQKRVYKSVVVGGYYEYERIERKKVELPPSMSEFTVSMSQVENSALNISLETDSWVESDTIPHPCVDEMKDCPFNKDFIKIRATSSYVSGFRFEKENISTYCFSDHWFHEFTPQVLYREECSEEKSLNLCRIKVASASKLKTEISSDKKVENSELEETIMEPTTNFARKRKFNKWEILKKNVEKMKWSAETLCASLEKYVFKTKFTERDKAVLLKASGKNETFDPYSTISHLINHSEDRFDLYAPAERLLQDLDILCSFPNNAEFLGMKNEMNYRFQPEFLTDTKDQKFISKSDVFLMLYHSLAAEYYTGDEFSKILLQSLGNKIYRKLKNCYELIPAEIAENVLRFVLSKLKNNENTRKQNSETMKLTRYVVNEVGMILSKFYDNKYDGYLLELLRDQLIAATKKKPIRLNKSFYDQIYFEHAHISNVIKSCLDEFRFVFQMFMPKLKNFPHYPVVRMFTFEGLMSLETKFVLAKDLSFALMNHKQCSIPKETSMQTENGLLLTVDESDLKNILMNGGLTLDDLNIIEVEISRTSRETSAPIIAVDGSHYKLASDVYNEIMEIFSTELRWFDSVPPKHFYKLRRWFESFLHIFDERINVLYLIEVGRIEELKEKAHKDLGKFPKKPEYDVPKNAVFENMEQVEEELNKISVNIGMEHFVLKASYANIVRKMSEKKSITKSDVFYIYNLYWKDSTSKDVVKLKRFYLVQMGGMSFYYLSEYTSKAITLKNEINMSTDSWRIVELDDIRIEPFEHIEGFTHLCSMQNLGDDRNITTDKIFIYDNDACLKKTLDFVLGDWVEYKTVFELIYEAEHQKMKDISDFQRIFYLRNEEVTKFCRSEKVKFNDSLNSLCESSDEEQNDKPVMFVLKNEFPITRYSNEFHKCVNDLLTKAQNPRLLINICLKVKETFNEWFEMMKSLRSYCAIHKERKVLMRIMCEMRIKDQREWHLFSEEVLEAIEVVLENENRLDPMKDQIEKWRGKWINRDTFSTVSVQLFETILSVAEIDKSKFVLVPDIEFCKNISELPLRMGYNALAVLSPFRRKVYHQVQAHYLIFQYGACDAFWHKDPNVLKDVQKARVFAEMLKIGKGYTSSEKVEESLEIVKNWELIQKTPLSSFFNKSYDDKLTKKRAAEYYKSCVDAMDLSPDLEIHVHKFLIMQIWIKNFFDGISESGLFTNIFKGLTVSFPIIKLNNMEDFESWMNNRTLDNMEINEMSICVHRTFMLTSFGNDFNEKKFIDKHYLFDDDDCLETFGWEKLMNGKKAKLEGQEEEEITKKLSKVLPKVVSEISEEIFEPIDNLWSLFQTFLLEEFDEEEAMELSVLLPTLDEFTPVKKAILEHLDITNIDGQDMYKRKKMEIVEPVKKVRVKPEREYEKPKIVTKYVTETRVVESCEKCREIEKDTTRFNKKCEELEKEIDENRRDIRQKDDDLGILKKRYIPVPVAVCSGICRSVWDVKARALCSEGLDERQITQNKQKYREEIQKQKEVIDSRDVRIEQLQEELKQYREELRLEREKLYAEVEKSSKLSNDNVKKMKIELENLKFTEKSKDQCIEKLVAEVDQLKIRLEISEEHHTETKEELKQSREILKNMESELAQNASFFEKKNQFEEDNGFFLEAYENFVEMETSEKYSHNHLTTFDAFGFLENVRLNSEKFGISSTEVQTFEINYNIYLEKMQDENGKFTRDVDMEWDKVQFPTMAFSDKFMQKYEKSLKTFKEHQKKHQSLEESYVCLICTDDIERLQQSTMCQKCGTKYHSKCATSWLRLNSICPACKAFLPDPVEYPNLN